MREPAASDRHSGPPYAALSSVKSTWQTEKGVCSLLVLQLRDHTALLSSLRVSSRDFS